MPRLPRFHVPGQPLHAIQRGNNREPIFAAGEDYAFYRECLLDAAKAQAVAVHAYVFMTNHVHALHRVESSARGHGRASRGLPAFELPGQCPGHRGCAGEPAPALPAAGG